MRSICVYLPLFSCFSVSFFPYRPSHFWGFHFNQPFSSNAPDKAHPRMCFDWWLSIARHVLAKKEKKKKRSKGCKCRICIKIEVKVEEEVNQDKEEKRRI
jgi:hypothetical protein